MNERCCAVLILLASAMYGSSTSAEIVDIPEANVIGVGCVPMESDYVPHVVACENGAASLEALKAQAVAARTFAYYKLLDDGFIMDGSSDQVYSCGNAPGAQHFAAAAATEPDSPSSRTYTSGCSGP